jgi:hypothetical protein
VWLLLSLFSYFFFCLPPVSFRPEKWPYTLPDTFLKGDCSVQ